MQLMGQKGKNQTIFLENPELRKQWEICINDASVTPDIRI